MMSEVAGVAALEIALKLCQPMPGFPVATNLEKAAAVELVRLHRLNSNLLGALQLADAALSGANMNMNVVEKAIKSTIAKALGGQS